MDALDVLLDQALTASDDLAGFTLLRRALDNAAASPVVPGAGEQLVALADALIARIRILQADCLRTGNQERHRRLAHWIDPLRTRMVHHLLMLSADGAAIGATARQYRDLVLEQLIPYWLLERERLSGRGDVGRVQAIDQRLGLIATALGETGARRVEAEQRRLAGQQTLGAGQVAAAEELFAQMRQLLDAPGLRHLLCLDMGRIAEAYAQQGDAVRSAAEYRRALQEAELLRAQTTIRFRAELSCLLYPLYAGAMAMEWSLGRYDACLLFMEMSKARSLLDLRGLHDLQRLGATPAVVAQGEDAAPRPPLQALLAEHDQAYQAQLRSLGASVTLLPDDLGQAVGNAYQALEEERAGGRLTTIVPAPFLALFEGTIDPSPLCATLPPQGVAIAYFLTDETLFIVLVGPQGVLKAERFALAAGFHQACRSVLDTLDRPTGPVRRDLLAYLYDVLIRPVADAIPAGTELLAFIPHGILHFLPFSALLATGEDGSQEHLVVRYDIVSARSLAVAHLLAAASEQPAGGGHGTALVMGNPDLGTPAADLPGADQEARAVAALLNTRPWLGAEATRSRFLAESPGAHTIVLACHARPSIANPLLGYLACSDGPLRVIDILDLDLTADLVALSGCHTQVQRLMPGDEGHGLVPALLAAGARTVLAAQWEVHDQAAHLLMTHFFLHHMQGGLSKPRALRLAQIELMHLSSTDRCGQQRDFSHPFYWAFPVLTGDWR
jgi:CHAT domain-containing protein